MRGASRVVTEGGVTSGWTPGVESSGACPSGPLSRGGQPGRGRSPLRPESPPPQAPAARERSRRGAETAVPAAARSRQLTGCSDLRPDPRSRRPRPSARPAHAPTSAPTARSAALPEAGQPRASAALAMRGAAAERGAGQARGFPEAGFPIGSREAPRLTARLPEQGPQACA